MSFLEQFEDFIAGEFTIEELTEIYEHGCSNAGAHEFIYYDEASKFWNDNLELCEGAATELAFEVYGTSLVDLIKSLDTGNEEWHNIKQNLLFVLIEHAAFNLVED